MIATDAPSSIADSSAWTLLQSVDTTRGSVLHRIFTGPVAGKVDLHTPRVLLALGCAICATYLPLLVTASIDLPSLTRGYGQVRLPLLRDWNLVFMFLASMPSLLAYTISDQQQLTTAIARIVREDIVVVPYSDAVHLTALWEGIFLKVNIVSQVLGVTIGFALAWANYSVYSRPDVGYWIVNNAHLTVSGIVFLYCIFLFYALIPVYVLRSLASAFFLRALVAHAEVRIVPFHPDHCGGLRPVGTLGLRNQYLLSIFGVNVLTLVAISLRYLIVPQGLWALMITAIVAYVILGPLVFLGPLMPFRTGMLRSKIELMNDVAQRLRSELRRIRGKLENGEITKEDQELIERLRTLGNLIEDLPVWPFDARTLRRFLTAYVVPLLGSVAFPVLRGLATLVYGKLGLTN